jgi:hypothetical protein
MDTDLAKTFLNGYVIVYLLTVVGGQLGCALWRRHEQKKTALRRLQQGLPDDVLLSAAQTLAENRRAALLDNAILLLTVIVMPFVLVAIAPEAGQKVAAGTEQNGVAIVFVGLLLWVLINGTDVAKAFLGGLAFRTVLAFKQPTPFQLGDRVTLKGIGGKVIAFDSFFVTLQTSNDDQISVPTASLWSDVLNSANAGERASLCVMNFYLAPFVTKEQRQAAEDTIWDAIQASPYYTPSKPMQIYFAQNPDSIQLTAKAYVASTYNEPLFTSDVTRAFLDFVAKKDIPVGSSTWRISVEPTQP